MPPVKIPPRKEESDYLSFEDAQMCHGQGCRYIGDGRPPNFNDGILIMGI